MFVLCLLVLVVIIIPFGDEFLRSGIIMLHDRVVKETYCKGFGLSEKIKM